ncbi:hypothetical protein V6N13_128851 [Hibiscus sabdariffa]
MQPSPTGQTINPRRLPHHMQQQQVDEDRVYRRQKKSDVRVGMDNQFDSCFVDRNHSTCNLFSKISDRSFVVVANPIGGSRSWIGGVFNRLSNKRNDKFIEYPLTPIQVQRLQKLQERIRIPFDETRPDHQEALKELWHIAFPNVALKGLISEQWKEMGWQGPNPSTDFRLLLKLDGTRATWEYPFAVAGINVSFMLIQMLDLFSEKPSNLPGLNFLKLLAEDEQAFDVLYCIAFEMVDAQWLAMHASYMEFNMIKPLYLPNFFRFASLSWFLIPISITTVISTCRRFYKQQAHSWRETCVWIVCVGYRIYRHTTCYISSSGFDSSPTGAAKTSLRRSCTCSQNDGDVSNLIAIN